MTTGIAGMAAHRTLPLAAPAPLAAIGQRNTPPGFTGGPHRAVEVPLLSTPAPGPGAELQLGSPVAREPTVCPHRHATPEAPRGSVTFKEAHNAQAPLGELTNEHLVMPVDMGVQG